MIMTLFLGGNAFQAIFMGLGGGDAIANFILGTQLSPIAVLFLMMGIVFFLGCFLDWLGILLIVTPIFIPVTMELGLQPAVVRDAHLRQPADGLPDPALRVLALLPQGHRAAGDERSTTSTKGSCPFVCLQWVGLILCIFVPEIIMWAPAKFFGPGVLG